MTGRVLRVTSVMVILLVIAANGPRWWPAVAAAWHPALWWTDLVAGTSAVWTWLAAQDPRWVGGIGIVAATLVTLAVVSRRRTKPTRAKASRAKTVHPKPAPLVVDAVAPDAKVAVPRDAPAVTTAPVTPVAVASMEERAAAPSKWARPEAVEAARETPRVSAAVASPAPPPPVHRRGGRIRALLADGNPTAEIARRTGVGQDAIRAIARVAPGPRQA